ncbi:MAG: MBL fold metallo-hydrolase [Phycisphaerales bacterium]|nr:MBL fold metallo-hydrolase [Phycisphaerales bacterium]
MLLRMIYDDRLAQAAYLIGCQKTGEAIVIDPERDVDRYVEAAAKEGLRIVAAAETHIHADFVSGARELAERGVRVYLSDEGDADWKYQWVEKKSGGGRYDAVLVRNGDVFRVGNIEFKVLHTPGHTPEHICFMVTDRGGGASEPMGVATGDFVFVGDLGRPDLLETAAGNVGSAEPSARRLFGSVGAFVQWPDYLQVWPGHGAGSACGKALGAVPQTTVGYEKRFNPAVRAASSEPGFVRFILDGQPEPPLYFARMKRWNKVGPPVLGGVPRPREMTAEELKGVDARRVAVVDSRPWKAFKDGHVAGALFVPHDGMFPAIVGSYIGEDEDVVLIAERDRVDAMVRDMIRVGIDRIVGWMEPGAMEQYARLGGKMATTPEIDVAEAKRRLGDGGSFFLDVRRRDEFEAGRLPGAALAPHPRLPAMLGDVPRDKRVIVNCRSGARSGRACALLQRAGYEVANVAGGWLAWDAMERGG